MVVRSETSHVRKDGCLEDLAAVFYPRVLQPILALFIDHVFFYVKLVLDICG